MKKLLIGVIATVCTTQLSPAMMPVNEPGQHIRSIPPIDGASSPESPSNQGERDRVAPARSTTVAANLQAERPMLTDGGSSSPGHADERLLAPGLPIRPRHLAPGLPIRPHHPLC
ncbi:MAG: hypothetical protein JO069_16570 [Verrucomicrobia bacterium]|nr:hypothetical protein [Verrucomicrobiota bacterium]